MKELLIAAVALVVFAGVANAQERKEKYKEKGARQEMRGGGIDRNYDELNLSTDQKKRIATINQDFRQQMESLRNENLPPDETRTRRETLQKQHVESIRAALTEEQRTKFDNMKHDGGPNEMKFKRKGDGPGMMGGGMERGLEGLNLTTDQKNKIASINQEFKQQLDNLKGETLSSDEIRTRRENLQKQHKERIHAILTEEQRNQLGKMKIKTKEGKTKYKSS